MHSHMNIKFVNAKQAKEHISIETPKKNCTKPMQQYGITKYADQQNKISSILVLFESCLQTYMTYIIAEYTVNELLMMGRGTV